MPALEGTLREGLTSLGLAISESQQQLLLDFISLLEQWNRSYNLTAVRDPLEMVSRHLLDSLAIQPWLQGQRILDIGAGAGLPGIPLAITNPEREFTLLDGNSKKTRFMEQARLTLGLSNMSVVHSRVEAYTPPDLFDCITARALAELGQLATWSKPLLSPDGCLLAMKGPNVTAEITQLPPNWGYTCRPLTVPDATAQRTLVILHPA